MTVDRATADMIAEQLRRGFEQKHARKPSPGELGQLLKQARAMAAAGVSLASLPGALARGVSAPVEPPAPAAAPPVPDPELTPSERAALTAVVAKNEQRSEAEKHARLRASGERPPMSLAHYQAFQAELSASSSAAKAQLAKVFLPGATKQDRIAAAKAAVVAFPQRLAEFALHGANGRWDDAGKRFRKRVSVAVRDVAADLAEAYESGRVGPHLPVRSRRNNALFVQQEDLDEVVPDGWGLLFPLDALRLGRRAGIPPSGVALLSLLTWVSCIREPLKRDKYRCGAGLQVSIDWLARKLGCSATWVKRLINQLDPFAEYRRECRSVKRENRRREATGKAPLPAPKKPHGTPLVQRFRQLKRYSELEQFNGEKRAVWVDSEGRPHKWVDVRGLLYITEMGRRCLIRRAHRNDTARPGHSQAIRPLPYFNDVAHRGVRYRWNVEYRLERGWSQQSPEILKTRAEISAAPALPNELPPITTLSMPITI